MLLNAAFASCVGCTLAAYSGSRSEAIQHLQN